MYLFLKNDYNHVVAVKDETEKINNDKLNELSDSISTKNNEINLLKEKLKLIEVKLF